MTDPPTKPPVFSLVSGSGFDSRKERQLRRSLTSLGATVGASRNDRWNPATTHLVAVGPVPCVKWVCAIASAASVHIVKPAFLEACIAANDVKLDPKPYAVSFALDDPMLLPASMDALWAGRIWAPAYAYWRQRAGDGKGEAPLFNHRVLVLGQLKPRGAAGLAAPSNKIVTDILNSAAAKVVTSVDEDPTFAIIAPGLDPARLPELKRALKVDILCLGSAFLVDLVCRVSADPSHYVMFESQKSLCGPLLDAKSCQSFEGSLPVSSKQLNTVVAKRQRRTPVRDSKRRKEDFKSPFSVLGPDDISTETPAPVSKRNDLAPDERMEEVLPAPKTVVYSSKVISPSTPAPQPAPGLPNGEETHSQQSNDGHEAEDAQTIRRRRVRKRSRNAGLSVKSTLQFDSPVKAKPAVRISEPFCVIRDRVDGRGRSQLFCQKEASKPSENNGWMNTLGKKAQRQGHMSTSGTLLEANQKGSALPTPQAESSNRGSSDNDEAGPPQREQDRIDMFSRAAASSIPRPNHARSKGPSIIDVGMFSQGDADTHFSRIAVPGDSALLKSRAIQSVEDGYAFVMGVLGGDPSKRDVDLLVRPPDQITDQESQRTSSEAPDVENAQTQPANVEESPALEEEELFWFDEADAAQCYGTQNERRGHGNTSRDATGDKLGKNGFSGRNEHSRRRERGGYGDVEVFRIPVPRHHITVSQVVQPRFAKIQYANAVRAACGNEADDENCQCEMKYIDWVLGAERLVGCSSDEMSEAGKSGRDSAVRRVCMSLTDSGALCRFGSTGGLNQVEALVLTGICTRLVLAGADFDPSPTLVVELLSLRENQCQAGFDSLEMVLSANCPSSVSLRHRAVATIWSVLTQEANRRSGRKGIWSYFNTTCSSRLEDLFSVSKVSKPEHLALLGNGLNWILESSLIVGYVHAIQVDFIEDLSQSMGADDVRDYPENWDVVCQCLEGFSGESGLILGQQKAAHDVLKVFLCNVAVYLAGRVWGVSEKVLGAFSKAISFLSKLRNENCYCNKPALFVSRFQALSDVNAGREGVMQHLKTPCDCYFFLGWVFATYGQGNAMKRAMGVIRNGSVFTGVKSSMGCSRAINHHVGITLAVADSLASASDNGEYLLCRTLTSKCPRLETVMDRYVAHGKEDDLCWRTTVEAIAVRCRVLHARGDSIHIYTNWLAQSVVGTFQKVRKSGERRPSSVAQREALRVQESVFASLALLTLSTIQEVTDLFHAKAVEGERDASATVLLYVEKSEINVLTFVRIASDLFSQMRSSSEEATSKSKGGLLCALLSVISNEVKLITYACRNKIGGESCRVKLSALEQATAKFRFIEDSSLENMLVGIVGNDLFDEDYDLALKMKCRAARALAQLIELKRSRKDFDFAEDDRKRIEEILDRGGLGGNIRQTPGFRDETAEKKIAQLRLQNRASMQFWSEAFEGGWGARLTQHGSRGLQDVIIRVTILGVAHLVEDRDAEVRILVRRLVSSLGRMPMFEPVVGNWVSEVHLLGDERIDSDENAEGEWSVPRSVQCVGSAVTSLAQGCVVGHMQSVIQGLESIARGWLTHSKDMATVRDGLLIYSHVLCVSAQLHGLRRGGSNAGWLQGWLVPITHAVQKLQRRSWQGRTEELSGTLLWVQERVMGALGTVEQSGRDLETRVCVVRMLNCFAHGEATLRGFWGGGGVEVASGAGLGRAEERRRFERNVREWQKVLFHSAVEDPLRGGNGARSYVELGYVLGRLVEALESFCADKERCAVLIWQARQVYARVMDGNLMGTLTGHVRLSLLWAKVERLIALTG